MKQEIPEDQLEEYALKLECKGFCMPIKGQSKTAKRREPTGSSPRAVPIEKRTWTDVEPDEYSLSDYDISKNLIHLHIEKMMERFNSGELKRIFRNISRTALIGLTTGGRKAWQEEEETRKYTSTVQILQE